MGCSQSSANAPAADALPPRPSNVGPHHPYSSSRNTSHPSLLPTQSLSRTNLGATNNTTYPIRGSPPLNSRSTDTNSFHAPAPFTSNQSPPPPAPNNASPLARTATSATTASMASTGGTAQRWTRTQLTKEREIFFDTRVTGHAEIWQAVRLAVDMARDTNDWAGAGEILNAAGCTAAYVSASGTAEDDPSRQRRPRRQKNRALDLAVYDERGSQYTIPPWVIGDPSDVIEDAGNVAAHARDAEVTDAEDEMDDDMDGDIADKEAMREKERVLEKGKEKDETDVVSESDAIHLRVRFDRGDSNLKIGKSWKVQQLRRRLAEERNLIPKAIKLFYLGRPLDDEHTLEAQGWQRGHTINAFVFEQ